MKTIGVLFVLGLLLLNPVCGQDLRILILSDAQNLPSTLLLSQEGQEERLLLITVNIRKNGRLFDQRNFDFLLNRPQSRLRIDDYLTEIGYGEQGIEQSINWELCAEAFEAASKLRVSSCQMLPSIPSFPPHLVYPFNEDEIESRLPNFTWTAPAPLSPKDPVRYQMKLVELVGYYPPKVAIRQLPALYLKEGLRSQIHPYPLQADKLEINKTYVWQIEARTLGGRYLGHSEVWTFRLKDPEAKKESKKPKGPFVELKRKLDGSYYPAFGFIHFRHDCEYEEDAIQWKIHDMWGNKLELPASSLEQVAKNLFSLEIPPGSGLLEGNYYVFEMSDPKGQTSKLKFKYFYY